MTTGGANTAANALVSSAAAGGDAHGDRGAGATGHPDHPGEQGYQQAHEQR